MTPNPSPLDRLRDPNPYDVLELPVNASTSEISKSFAAAMKRRAYPVDVIARSRKRLLDPDDRRLAAYLRIEPPKDETVPRPIGIDVAANVEYPAHLDGLSDLLTANDQDVLGFDQLLGNRIFG